MATLRQEAQAYEPPQTYNICQLEKIPLDMDLKTGEGKDKDGNPFSYKYIEVDGKQYRVPASVIGQAKAVIKKQPHVKYVTVDRQGEGMNTRYIVMPYLEVPTEQIK